MIKPKVAIIGAGFSGLTLAWALKDHFQVEVFEKSDRCGGLLRTDKEVIPVEYAANALLASQSVEKLFDDLQLTPIRAGFRSNNRYIFNKEPRRLPVSWFTLIQGVFNVLKNKWSGTVAAKENETVSEWTKRCLNQPMNDYMVSPAFQGIYGATSDQLSAELIIDSALNSSLKTKKGKLRGSIAPKYGMQDLIRKLQSHLEQAKVKFHFQSQNPSTTDFAATVLAISCDQAATIIPQLAEINMTTLTSVTMGFAEEKKIRGFGCLFPEKENFNSLGVLFNSDIFENRGPLQSETWILKDTDNPVDKILEDRKRLTGKIESPKYFKILKYPKALPLYDLKLKRFLLSDNFLHLETPSLFEVFKNGARLRNTEKPTYLTGNYLGGIGLAKILDYNLRLANRMKKDLYP